LARWVQTVSAYVDGVLADLSGDGDGLGDGKKKWYLP
jgi:hypothetical protein